MQQSPGSIRSPQIIAVTNNKGGVGKTTTALNVAAELAHRGHRTLLIDLDMQANATTGLFKRGAPGGRTVGMGLLSEAAAAELITKTSLENLSLLPANIHLAKQSEELYRQEGYEQRLKQLLVPVAATYDFVIIDCPPMLGAMTYVALTAATAYLVPCEPEKYSFDGLRLVVNLASGVQAQINPDLKMAGVFFTKYNPKKRSSLHHDIVDAAEHLYPDKVLPNIRADQSLAQAQRAGEPTILYKPDCNGVADYAALTTAILENL